MWNYSKRVCESNAQIEGWRSGWSFKKPARSQLPFEDGAFDAAVSNLVFHEVSDTKDKRELIREALRVVKKGGKFSFQDLFLEQAYLWEYRELFACLSVAGGYRGWSSTELRMRRLFPGC